MGLSPECHVNLIFHSVSRTDDEEQTRVSLNCSQQALMQVVAFLSQNRQLYQKTEILSLEKVLKISSIAERCLADSFVNCYISRPSQETELSKPESVFVRFVSLDTNVSLELAEVSSRRACYIALSICCLF